MIYKNYAFLFLFSIYVYDRLRSEFRLKSVSTPQIGIHWRHYLKSWSDLRVFSNRYLFQILRSMADLLVRVRAYISDVIGRGFEKVRNSHRFENLKKGHSFGCLLEARHWSESYIYIYKKYINPLIPNYG